MSKNEKDYIINNYIIGIQANLRLFCNKIKGKDLFDKFIYSVEYNRPDMYFVNDKYCYIFEHFEIDASSFIKGKGSAYKRNISIADKQLEKQSNEIIKNSIIEKDKISTHGSTFITTTQEASKENLRNNFIRIFDNHYKNIEEYKQNLTNHLALKNKKFKTIFIIELTPEFGGYIIKDGEYFNLELFYFGFVLEKLKSAINVNYVIFLNKSDNNRFFNIIEHCNLEKLLKYKFDFNKENIFFLNQITTITTTGFIPKSKLKKSKPNT